MSRARIEIGGVSFDQINGAWVADDTILGKNVTFFPGSVLGRPPVSTKSQVRKVKKGTSLSPLTIGDNCVIGANVVIYRGARVGNNCLVGDTACIREGVYIGESCIIAMGVTINYDTRIGARVKIMDNTHLTGNMIIEGDVFISTHVSTANDNSMGRENALNKPIELRVRKGPIIRRFATIGEGAAILPGVEIGENVIIGANSVVTKSLPKGVVALGVPARIIRELREDELRE